MSLKYAKETQINHDLFTKTGSQLISPDYADIGYRYIDIDMNPNGSGPNIYTIFKNGTDVSICGFQVAKECFLRVQSFISFSCHIY